MYSCVCVTALPLENCTMEKCRKPFKGARWTGLWGRRTEVILMSNVAGRGQKLPIAAMMFSVSCCIVDCSKCRFCVDESAGKHAIFRLLHLYGARDRLL